MYWDLSCLTHFPSPTGCFKNPWYASGKYSRRLIMAAHIPATGFLRLTQVLEIVPVSKSSWWQGCKTGRYPEPVKLSPRTTAWRAEDIAALVEQLGKTGGR
jgi:predicted DNA-binding transcriptional regulator AlpA